MRSNSFGRYLIWFVGAAFLMCLVIGEVLVLKLTPLNSIERQNSAERSGDKEEHCSEIEPWRPYTLTVQQYACTFAFKNLIFIDTYHDTINALSALFVALFTFTLWRSTDKLWQASKTQSNDMQDSIRQAVRSATAMEAVAEALKTNTEQIIESVDISRKIADTQHSFGRMQLRAYLSVLANDASFQERDRDVAFEGRGVMINKGNTPAHKVTYWANCDILSVPIPSDFAFPPPPKTNDFSAVLGAQNNFIINAMLATSESANFISLVKRFVNDNEVADIKLGIHRALYMWGAVSYEDAFGAPHTTKFSFWFIWQSSPDGEIKKAFYTAAHNEAD